LAAPENAEALALGHAIQLAHVEGFDRVIFAMECLSLVHRLNSSVMDRSSVGLLVNGNKAMTISFTTVSFIHVKRNLNEATHILANSFGNFTSSDVFYSKLDCIRGCYLINKVLLSVKKIK
jgi:hypothetical protein